MPGVDQFTKLLLHCDGTNGGTSFPESARGKSVSSANGLVTSTTQKKFGTASAAFGTSSGAIIMNDGGSPYTDLLAGSGDYTIDFWHWLQTAGHTEIMVDFRPLGGAGIFHTIYSNAGALTYHANSTNIINGAAITAGQWNHVAVTRQGTNARLFLNGTQTGGTQLDNLNYATLNSQRPFFMNDSVSAVNAVTGFMDEIRISIGVARWTANFTPPAAPYSKSGGFWI